MGSEGGVLHAKAATLLRGGISRRRIVVRFFHLPVGNGARRYEPRGSTSGTSGPNEGLLAALIEVSDFEPYSDLALTVAKHLGATGVVQLREAGRAATPPVGALGVITFAASEAAIALL